MRVIENSFDAWHFLADHPMNTVVNKKGNKLSYDNYGMDIHYAKVDPVTHTVEDDESRNTLIEVWLEYGPYEDLAKDFPEYDKDFPEYAQENFQRTHDPALDCGGPTFDEALIVLANKVLFHYGDYKN